MKNRIFIFGLFLCLIAGITIGCEKSEIFPHYMNYSIIKYGRDYGTDFQSQKVIILKSYSKYSDFASQYNLDVIDIDFSQYQLVVIFDKTRSSIWDMEVTGIVENASSIDAIVSLTPGSLSTIARNFAIIQMTASKKRIFANYIITTY